MHIIDIYLDIFDFCGGDVAVTQPADRAPEFFSRQVRAARRFYLDLAPPAETQLAVVCGGCEQCAADYEIHRQTFPYYSVEFVARGRGELVLATRRQELLPGTVFAYGPGIAQQIRTDAQEPLEKYFVDFAGPAAPGLLSRHGLQPGSVRQVSALSELEAAFELLVRDGCQGTGFATQLCTQLLEYLLLKVVQSRLPGTSRQTSGRGHLSSLSPAHGGPCREADVTRASGPGVPGGPRLSVPPVSPL